MTASGEAFERVEITSRQGLRDWLEANHARADSVWLVTWKIADRERYVPYDAIVEEALCFGWIDSQPRRLDAERSMRLLSPRKAGSGWSKLNRERVERLLAEGRMAPPGLAKIEAAKADGSWQRLDAVETLVAPADLVEALRADAQAKAAFEGFPPSARRAILEWIAAARAPETRARRIAETVSQAALGLRANQPRQPKRVMAKPGEGAEV
ncbi:YdeI family protein [uncultured Caulobacter sp.]|uniref:YdeI/OmpD-associated family protein n=1 Tax=uncultured Caulobacter sp. TaxID=158749 RepID=UPI00263A3727|nr:YdeI/OmpD-associated family protein [uncultured Caulobacter sp.]